MAPKRPFLRPQTMNLRGNVPLFRAPRAAARTNGALVHVSHFLGF
jgi:hypothetical protein